MLYILLNDETVIVKIISGISSYGMHCLMVLSSQFLWLWELSHSWPPHQIGKLPVKYRLFIYTGNHEILWSFRVIFTNLVAVYFS